jgi:ribonuclease E
MSKKMLIDATHPEETRVVVVDGSKVEEFDFESLNKRQLAGNIYLAKITRVEPSLQAAFVEYGGNRHGFLAFSEIHPDYYQIPVADREAILAAEEAANASEDDAGERPAKARAKDRAAPRSRTRAPRRKAGAADEAAAPAEEAVATAETSEPARDDAPAAEAHAGMATETAASAETPAAAQDAPSEAEPAADPETPRGPGSIAEGAGADAGESVSEDYVAEAAETPADGEASPAKPRRNRRTRGRRRDDDDDGARADAEPDAAPSDEAEPEKVESIGGDTVEEEVRPRRARARSYKIQEVVKVRQIMLVQVVKEERGTKGAALTTYLSLAGRYCVLMPNTARGGGISRKITDAADRKKLKEIASEFEVPKGMGLIIRTAGAQRTRTEIRRDYEFLLRQWEEVRELTLKSIAPTLIYEEGSLIKRSIRDLYTKDIEAILVEGDEGYREAKDYMRMLMPSHARNVQAYREDVPLFSRHQVESYLAAMFNPTVQLKSGGYIVIGITEALVAIDVNSGRSTREGSIEETALKTNLEAADEVARQLRLRDLAGLIVIDFIDMDERRNNAAVEKRMKDRLKSDRARIQIGRISAFGLMEMSRQRLRPGMLEASTAPCPHCHGSGLIRSADSLALSILREIEEEGVRNRSGEVKVIAPVQIANFIMNQKRDHLIAIEARYAMSVLVEGDPALISPDHRMERVKAASRPVPAPARTAVRAENGFAGLDDPRDAEPAEEDEAEEISVAVEKAQPRHATAPKADAEGDSDASRAKRRRGKRGGKKRRRNGEDIPETTGAEQRPAAAESALHVYDEDGADAGPLEVSHSAFGAEIGAAADPRPEVAPAATTPEPAVTTEPAQAAEPAAAKAVGPATAKAEEADYAPAPEAGADAPADPDAASQTDEPARPKRTGWWSFGSR